MMKTMILLCVSVLPCCLAGVVGCNSDSQSERPAASQESTDNVLAPPLADHPLDVSLTSPAADESSTSKASAKAKADNPRVGKFAELDTDQDGLLSITEFSVGRSPKDAAKWFGRRDGDHDGFLSLVEFVPQSASSAGSKPPDEKPRDKSLSPAEPSK